MASLSAGEYDQWLLYNAEEPWGAVRDNVHMAVLASLIANANRDPQKKPTPFKSEDFMLRSESQRKEREQSQRSGFVAFLRAVAKKVKK